MELFPIRPNEIYIFVFWEQEMCSKWISVSSNRRKLKIEIRIVSFPFISFPGLFFLLSFSWSAFISFTTKHRYNDTWLQWKTMESLCIYINRLSRMNEIILDDNQDEESSFALLSNRNLIGCFCYLSNGFHFLSVWLAVAGCCDKQCISIENLELWLNIHLVVSVSSISS